MSALLFLFLYQHDRIIVGMDTVLAVCFFLKVIASVFIYYLSSVVYHIRNATITGPRPENDLTKP